MPTYKVSEASFSAEVIDNSTLTLVDFWAEWCGPCRVVGPTLESLADEYDNRVKICKINIDENPDIATQYNVRSIPTFLLFKNGQVIDTQVGSLSRTTFTDWFNKHL